MNDAWLDYPWLMPATYHTQPQVAISACLNGERVRYDGAEKALATASLLADQLQLLPLCPEVAAGMTVPRPPIQLVEIGGQILARGRDNADIDMTTALHKVRQYHVERFGQTLCGYIFKSRSPSCGLHSTPLFTALGEQITLSSGLQAEYFQQQLPWLAFSEETRLQTASQCQRFAWACRLVFDLRLASQQRGLAVIHHHYRGLIEQLPADRQAQLNACLQATKPLQYRQLMVGACLELDNGSK
jgi:uncharacterized protein YbbK (DUF523 family)